MSNSSASTTPGAVHNGSGELPVPFKRGLAALGLISVISSISTIALISFLAFRMVRWRHYYKSPLVENQQVILILCLLITDLVFCFPFSWSWYWYTQDEVGTVPRDSRLCHAQAYILHLGDVGSMAFILAIAAQTCYQVGLRRQLSHKWFVTILACIAVFAIILTSIAPAAHGWGVYSSAGAWCWISQEYESLRLGTLYIWIFLTESLCIIIYGALWFKLSKVRKNIHMMNNSDTISDYKIKRAAMLMALYPLVYVMLTLPLASTRMALYAHKPVPNWVYIMDGCMQASCGYVDCILYVFTRRALLRDDLKTPLPSPTESQHPVRGEQFESMPTIDTEMAQSEMARSLPSSSEEKIPNNEPRGMRASSGQLSPRLWFNRRSRVGEARTLS